MPEFSALSVWRFLFFLLPCVYGLYYAPYGVNETDGGFLTGLAWHLKNGGMLYRDVIYVRPPLPLWLRALELSFLPENWAVLGERWIFYLKLALYSGLSASMLARDARKWQLTCLAFVVSVHCYPAAAWHTVDGILFAVLGLWLAQKTNWTGVFFGGVSIFASLLCKQSFYPLALFFPLYLAFHGAFNPKKMLLGLFGMLSAGLFFLGYLLQNGLLQAFLTFTSGAANGAQGLEHGVLDFFRITPELLLPSLVLLLPLAWKLWRGQKVNWMPYATAAWLLALPLSYLATCLLRQEYTAPFAQSRILFVLAAVFALLAARNRDLKPAMLLSVSWCAAVSWGYNLPVLFAAPLVWGGMSLWDRMDRQTHKAFSLIYFLLLLLAARTGYEFVYRDGKRSQMQADLGSVYPALKHIYSDSSTLALYTDLKQLQEKYGPNYVVLPSFPQAHFLDKSPPVLPLDWVVNRETNGDNRLVYAALERTKPVVFLEKSYPRSKIESDPELEISKYCLDKGTIIEETPHFYVIQITHD